MIEEVLKEANLESSTHIVTDGPQAVDFLYQRGDYTDVPRPDLILLDLHLPQMDGDEILAEAEDVVADIPVIALSGSQHGAEVKLEDIEDKVDECQVKPLKPDVLRKIT